MMKSCRSCGSGGSIARPAQIITLDAHRPIAQIGVVRCAWAKLSIENNRKNVELLAAARYARAGPRNDMTSSAGETTRD